MEFLAYRNELWSDVQAFLRAHWRPNHPFTQPELFNWQLAGFGGSDRPVAHVVRDRGEVVGFLGGIPGLYHRDGEIVPGVAFDVWIVHPDLQNKGLGLLLMKALEDHFEACCSLGVNRDIVHYYTRRGYTYTDALHRWIASLSPAGCRRLLATCDGDHAALNDLCERALAPTDPAVHPETSIDPTTLEQLYTRTAAQVLRFGLQRTAEFWAWRYLRSPGYKYFFFGDAIETGAIIARVEQVFSPDQPELSELRVLRLIELLPPTPTAWNGAFDECFAALLSGVLQWAVEQNCVVADFQHSSDRLAPLLEPVGFVRQSSAAPAAIRSIPHLFQPLRYDVRPINFVLRPWRAAARSAMDMRDVYVVKSDAGMDRPNVWPLPTTPEPVASRVC